MDEDRDYKEYEDEKWFAEKRIKDKDEETDTSFDDEDLKYQHDKKYWVKKCV